MYKIKHNSLKSCFIVIITVLMFFLVPIPIHANNTIAKDTLKVSQVCIKYELDSLKTNGKTYQCQTVLNTNNYVFISKGVEIVGLQNIKTVAKATTKSIVYAQPIFAIEGIPVFGVDVVRVSSTIDINDINKTSKHIAKQNIQLKSKSNHTQKITTKKTMLMALPFGRQSGSCYNFHDNNQLAVNAPSKDSKKNTEKFVFKTNNMLMWLALSHKIEVLCIHRIFDTYSLFSQSIYSNNSIWPQAPPSS